MAARKLGDFSQVRLPEDNTSFLAPFFELVDEHGEHVIDRNRYMAFYGRKSNPSGHIERDNYLLAQERLRDELLKFAPSGKFLEFCKDTGHSAWLGIKFRESLNELYEKVGKGEVGLIAVLDVSRLFRDGWGNQANQFAYQLAENNTLLLTSHHGVWYLLDMRKDEDRKKFHGWAVAAFYERQGIQIRTGISRDETAGNGNVAGGCSKFGWCVIPGRRASETKDGMATKPRFRVYEPHAKIKMQVMQAADRDDITTWTQLERWFLDNIGTIPPFEDIPGVATREELFARSNLARAKVWSGGHKHKSKATDDIIPTDDMLRSMVLEPLAVGVYLYGSGTTGKYAKRKHLKIAREMQVNPCTLIRDGKVYVNTFPEFAICKTPEEIDLYHRLAKKWADVRIWDAPHDEEYETKRNTQKSAGLKRGKIRGIDQINHWAGIIFCLRHGWELRDRPWLDHTMVLTSANSTWVCNKDHIRHDLLPVCSRWGCNDLISKILDDYFLRQMREMLTAFAAGQINSVIESLVDQRNTSKQKLESLSAKLAKTEKQIRNLEEVLKDKMEAWLDLGYSRERRKELTQQYEKEELSPVRSLLFAYTDQIADMERQVMNTPPEQSEQEIIEWIKENVNNWHALSCSKRILMIRHFIDYVGVLVPDGTEQRESLLFIQWKNGQVHLLVQWRNADRDVRPFTDQEREAIQKFWPQEDGWNKMKPYLLPHRKYSTVRHFAVKQGLLQKRGRVLHGWQEAAKLSDRSWGDRNMDVYFLQTEVYEFTQDLLKLEWCWVAHMRDGGEQYLMEPPQEVVDGVMDTLKLMEAESGVNDWSSQVTTHENDSEEKEAPAQAEDGMAVSFATEAKSSGFASSSPGWSSS